MERTPDEEELRAKICKKIDYLLCGINDLTTRDVDLIVAQTVQALSDAYKNLGGRE